MLLVWNWPQPLQQVYKVFNYVLAISGIIAPMLLGTLVTTIMSRWAIVIRILQITIVGIAMALYLKKPRQRRTKWTRYLDAAGTTLFKAANKGTCIVGDAIESSCRTEGRRRRVVRATTNLRKQATLVAFTVLAMQVNATISTEREVRFDTDSASIGIDNRCSACISHCQSDFEPESLRKCNRVVKGFGGSRVTNVQVGTLRWSWEDDDGVIYNFRIPNSYYVPAGKMQLLSPQHWAQLQASARSENGKCYERTDDQRCILNWNFGSSKRTVELGRTNNVATFSLAPGYKQFGNFCCEADISEETQPELIALPSGIISDDEEDDEVEQRATEPPDSLNPPSQLDSDSDPTLKTTSPVVEFNMNEPDTSTSEGEGTVPMSTRNVIIDEEDRQPSDLGELFKLHHQFGHISMRKLQEMARQGLVPK